MTDTIEMKALPLKRGETVLLNGVPLHMTEDGGLEVPAEARVLTREQLILDSSQADTAAKRIYFVLQAMSLDPRNAEQYREELLDLLGQRAENSQLKPILVSLATIDDLVRNKDFLAAMDLCRHLIDFDDAVLRDYPPNDTAS